jgi:hypothetical protein
VHGLYYKGKPSDCDERQPRMLPRLLGLVAGLDDCLDVQAKRRLAAS